MFDLSSGEPGSDRLHIHRYILLAKSDRLVGPAHAGMSLHPMGDLSQPGRPFTQLY
jgi:hypothetical protein